MNKNIIKLLLGLAVLLIIFVLAFLALLQDNGSEISVSELRDDYNMIFFTGDDCPPCEEVEDYIESQDILDKADLLILEVYNDLENAQLFEEKFNKCSPQPRTYGVPLLWDNQFCIVGPIEIINYLENTSN